MPEPTDVFVITRNAGEALLNLGYFADEEDAADMAFALNCEMPQDAFDVLPVSLAGTGCSLTCTCGAEEEPSAPECLGADDPACVCTECLERRLGL